MILQEASGLLSALDESQRYHRECAVVLNEASSPLILSPFVLAELDYLLMRHVGVRAQTDLLGEVSDGVYRLEPFAAAEIARAKEILERYADLEIGLADASIVVLAEKYGVSDVLTLDERHFRALRIGGRKRFRLRPTDR